MRRLAVGLSLALATVACSATDNSAAVTTTAVVVPATATAPSAVPTSRAEVTVPTLPTATATSTGRSVIPSASGTTANTTSTPAADCAATTWSRLSEVQRLGQLLMVGVPADDLPSAPALLDGLPVGGVFLAGRSTAGSADLSAAIAAIQRFAGKVAGVRLHIAVDQEGGYVQSLQGADFPPIPSAVEQGQHQATDLGAATAIWASSLVGAGISLDLAPVADVVPDGTTENPPIGAEDRQYGSTPDSVAAAVVAVVKAMLAAKLGTTVKHFPGLGRVTANTDTSADAVDGQTTPTDGSLQPFIAAIRADTTAVMISSAKYPQLDPDNVAAFSSKIITGLLRERLGFNGLVISDDLGAAVAVSDVGVGARAVDFIKAGGDLVLTVKPTDLPAMTAALAGEAARSSSFRSRVEDAALHVLRSKQKLGMLGCE